jgi:hypothetical protein
MNMPTHRTTMRTGLAIGLVMLCMVVGCSPPDPKPPVSGAAKTVPSVTNKAASLERGTNIALAEVNSFFDDKLKNARDPFFPVSARLERQSVATSATAVPKPSVEVVLVLNGIMGTSSQRMALINGRTFEPGDEVVIRTTNGQARVRCLEIGPQSVIVTVNGMPERRKLVLKK